MSKEVVSYTDMDITEYLSKVEQELTIQRGYKNLDDLSRQTMLMVCGVSASIMWHYIDTLLDKKNGNYPPDKTASELLIKYWDDAFIYPNPFIK